MIKRGLTHELIASRAFVERNFNLTKRYWQWELVGLIYTVANSVTIGFIGKGIELLTNTKIDTSYWIMYMLLGSILWGYLSIIFEIVSQIVSWERWEETIEYTFMAPVKRITHMLSVCIYAIGYGFLRSVLVLLVVAFFFKINISQANFLSATGILLIASISFMGLGMCAAVLPLISPERGSQAVGIFQSLLLMFSGVYYEISILPPWMQFVAKLSPATYALKGMREAILRGTPFTHLWLNIYPLIIMSFVLFPLGVIVFNRAEYWAKKKGVLKRSG
jgi:ABC-2 type transport system permease protein